ncbi:hypothetical protein SDC9_198544 [bioreactor metagenome]|uniref:Uncharacterized protein n=1 Tax=bioreactor metagenome TaxID=1076179 RepID=A0A645IR94_9ZZZZ
MGDVTALCSRVLIINHGRLLYDGDLGVLTERLTPYKILEVRLADVPAIEWDAYGQLVSSEAGKVTLRVPRELISAVSAELLQRYEVHDLNIEDPPMEEVISLAFREESHVS